MIAAMISKVIGLLYKSPLSNIIGSLGMGYTSLAQNAYMILLMIASFSIPQAVSKLISECYQRTGCSSPGQYLISQKMSFHI